MFAEPQPPAEPESSLQIPIGSPNPSRTPCELYPFALKTLRNFPVPAHLGPPSSPIFSRFCAKTGGGEGLCPKATSKQNSRMHFGHT
jgi:hypothetical protein